MAVFRDFESGDGSVARPVDQRGSLGFELLVKSPLVLYCSGRLLRRDIGSLGQEGFEVRECDASEWGGRVSVEAGVLGAFETDDCNGSLDYIQEVIESRILKRGDTVLVVWNAHAVVGRTRAASLALLDSMVTASRRLQLSGRSFLVLLHSRDRDLALPAVGGCKPWWNPDEFVRSDRVPEV